MTLGAVDWTGARAALQAETARLTALLSAGDMDGVRARFPGVLSPEATHFIENRDALEEIPTGTRMTIHGQYPDLASLEKILAMGAVEGMSLALGQIDALLDI